MSSARLLLALAVLGLAACAHTPSNTAYILPDIRHGAPVIVKHSADVPAGYDDHVVISVNHQALRQSRQQATLSSHGRRYYHYYGRSGGGSSGSSGAAGSSSGQAPVTRPPANVSAGPAMPGAPRRSGNHDRHRSHD